MASIMPTYDAPKVETTAAGQTQMKAMADPLAGLGKGLASAGASLATVTREEEEKTERNNKSLLAAAKEERIKEENMALNKAKSAVMYSLSEVMHGKPEADGSVTPGLSQTQGENATGLIPKYKMIHEVITGKGEAELEKYPQAKELFRLWATEHYVNNATELGKHEVRQRQETAVASAEVMAKAAYDSDLVKYRNGEEVDLFNPENDLAKGIKTIGTLRGWTNDVTERKIAEKRSDLLADMIKVSLSEKDVSSAKQLLTDFKDRFTEHNQTVVNQLSAEIKEEENWQLTDVKAKEVYELHKPANIDKPFDLEAMRKTIRSDNSMDHTQKLLAEKKVEEFAREYHAQKAAHEEGVTNEINAGFQSGETLSGLRRKVATSGVDSAAKGNLYDWLDRKFKVHEKDAEAKQAKQLQFFSNFLTFQNKYTRGDYGVLTPAQVATKFASQFGGFTNNAMEYVDNVGKDLGTARLDHEELKGLVRVLRENDSYRTLIPDPESKDNKDQAKLALLNSKVKEIQAASRTKPGSGLSTREALLKAITPYTTDVSMFGDTVEPAFAIGTDLSSKHGKNPSNWSKDTQNRYISDKFYSNPANKGKFLDFKTMERYRKILISGGL